MSLISPTSPSSRAIVHSGFRKARDTALAGLFAGDRVIIVTGPPGTGKTLLLEELETVLRASGWHTRSNVPTAQIDSSVVTADRSAPRALFIDDAKIDDSQIQQILRIAKVAVILSGPIGVLSRHQAAIHVDLSYLSASGSADFIAAWLSRAGKPCDALGREALARVSELCLGSPRALSTTLNELTRRSGLQPQAALTTAEVEAAARHVGLSPSPPPVADEQPAAADERDESKIPPFSQSETIGGDPKPDPAEASASSDPARSNLAHPALAGLFLGVALGLFGLWFLDTYSASPDTVSAPAFINDAALNADPPPYSAESRRAADAPDHPAGSALPDDAAAR